MKALNLTKEIIIAVFQIVTMVIFYPVLFAMALNRKLSKYGFNNISRVMGIYIFPAFGKWYLPVLDV